MAQDTELMVNDESIGETYVGLRGEFAAGLLRSGLLAQWRDEAVQAGELAPGTPLYLYLDDLLDRALSPASEEDVARYPRLGPDDGQPIRDELAVAKSDWDVGDPDNPVGIDDVVMEWAGCREAAVEDDGDVWIADPQAGHWLNNRELAGLSTWMRERGYLPKRSPGRPTDERRSKYTLGLRPSFVERLDRWARGMRLSRSAALEALAESALQGANGDTQK